jgi:hypothetical protein
VLAMAPSPDHGRQTPLFRTLTPFASLPNALPMLPMPHSLYKRCASDGAGHLGEGLASLGLLRATSQASLDAASFQRVARCGERASCSGKERKKERKVYARGQACLKGTRVWLGPPDLFVPGHSRQPDTLTKTFCQRGVSLPGRSF